MFFGKKKEQGSSPVKTVFEQLENGEFLHRDHMVYWRWQNQLTGTTAFEEEQGSISLDMDILDTWFYPKECDGRRLEEEDRSFYEKGAVRFLENQGYVVALEYSAQDGMAKRKHL